MEKFQYCRHCGGYMLVSRKKFCDEDCRQEYRKFRAGAPEAKFTVLKRVLESEKIYPRDDKMIHSLDFYSALLAWGCIYCSAPLEGFTGHCLDRQNGGLHNSWNVVPCCPLCNETKSDNYSFEEFILLVPGLVEIRRRRGRWIAGGSKRG